VRLPKTAFDVKEQPGHFERISTHWMDQVVLKPSEAGSK
jgi:hypothetical protein